ncbi:MAG: hypothetical protein PHP50_06070 [Lachnospiraceae bacterium]|nr:hypothetical protein [Lachnospiraceae bacterium]
MIEVRKGTLVMLQKEQLVMYGTIGLCRIVTVLPGEQSYVLEPISQGAGQLVVSLDNQITVRELLSREEIWEAIRCAAKAEKVWYGNPDMRSLEYRQAERKTDFSEWIRLSILIRHAKQKSKRDTLQVSPADTKVQKVFERLALEEYCSVFETERDIAKKELKQLIKESEVD